VSVLTIDTLTEADLDAALAIDLASFATSEIGQRQLREELHRPWARLIAAREDGALVGYTLYWCVVDEVHLLNIAVRPDRRRHGIARALMEELFSHGRSRSARKVLLEVRASNAPAIALYERLGFTEFNVRRRYYADNEDAVEMSFEL
jgi:ribosomal-protein-alanine N-acetyltransferase